MIRWTKDRQIEGKGKWLILLFFFGILWSQLHGTVLAESQEQFPENGEASHENASGETVLDSDDPDFVIVAASLS